MQPDNVEGDLAHVLLTEEQISDRIAELAAEIDEAYQGRDLLLVGVLNGAVMVMADLARALSIHANMDWMAILIVEDILDSGLTLSWLLKNLRSRKPASLEIFTLLRKPDAVKVDVEPRYVGFDIPNEFVVGYGLDYAQRYRNLRCVGTLSPHVYSS